jgi:hypothetical protein
MIFNSNPVPAISARWSNTWCTRFISLPTVAAGIDSLRMVLINIASERAL